MKPLTNYKVFTAEATKINFFAGREKVRMQLSYYDQTNKFAIGLIEDGFLEEDAIKWDRRKNWVPLKTNNGIVKAEISSIAERFHMSKQEVIRNYSSYKLEETIRSKVLAYENDIKLIIEEMNNELYLIL